MAEQSFSGTTRVALAISRERNRALLVDLLDEYEVVDLADPVQESADICIVDEQALRRKRESLVDWRTAEHPVYAPVLLLTETTGVDPWTRHAEDLGEYLDAIQPIPASKAAIEAQIDSLLETRRYAVQLADERDRSQAIFEGAFDAMVLADDDGVYTDANPAATDLFGVPREELIGQRIADFATGNYDFDGAWHEFREHRGERGLFELERPDGERRIVEYSATSDVVPGQHLSILRDVTARFEAEAELQNQHRRLETILENAPVVLWAVDADGRYSFVAGKGMAETGVEADDLIGETFYTQFEDQPEAVALLEDALAGDVVHGDVRFGGRDFEVWAEPVADETGDGTVPSVIGVGMDVTETHAALADVRARQDQIAFFNSLLRHEVLNGLAVVLGNAEILDEEFPDDHELSPHVDRIYSRSLDIVDIVRRIRTVLTRLTVVEPEVSVHDLATVTRDRLAQVESDYPDADVTLDAPTNAPVYADNLLGDVIYNVVSNAIQHNDRDVPVIDVVITAGTTETVLRIVDNGPGIPEKVRTSIFGENSEERSWATAGTFGLYFVKTMVDRYDGTIETSEGDPRGTILEIALSSAPQGTNES